jgi:hypothetical protein
MAIWKGPQFFGVQHRNLIADQRLAETATEFVRHRMMGRNQSFMAGECGTSVTTIESVTKKQ